MDDTEQWGMWWPEDGEWKKSLVWKLRAANLIGVCPPPKKKEEEEDDTDVTLIIIIIIIIIIIHYYYL